MLEYVEKHALWTRRGAMLARSRYQNHQEEQFGAILIIFEGLPSKSEFISEGHKAVPTSTAPDDDEDRREPCKC